MQKRRYEVLGLPELFIPFAPGGPSRPNSEVRDPRGNIVILSYIFIQNILKAVEDAQ